MKKLLLIVLASFCTFAMAQNWTNGYFKKDGTYVQGYQKSEPNEHRYDNRNSQSNGGSQRDEYSNPPAYNKSSPSYNPYEAPVRKCRKDAYGNTNC